MATAAEYNRINNVCLVILTSIALTMALIYTKPVLVPFVLAMFIYTSATPLVYWFEDRLKAPHLVSVGITFMFIFLCFSLCIALIGSSLSVFFEGASTYKTKILSMADQVIVFLEPYGLSTSVQSVNEAIAKMPAFQVARKFTGGVLGFVSNAVLISVFLIFLFVSGSRKTKKNKLISEIQLKISKYVLVKLMTSLGTGVLVGIILTIFGVDLAFMFAVLTVLFNFIPSIGSVIATVLPVPVIMLQFGVGYELPLLIVLLGIVQFGIGNILEPKIMGENMDLHPVTVLAFLIFWGLVWGLPGMFLAVPITAILKIVLSRIPTTKVAAEILAGRIPTTWK